MSFVPDDWQASSGELAGKTILVTGANRGIGEAVALKCAQHGAEVLLLGRDEDALAQVYDQIVDLGCPTPGIIPLDLTTRDPSLYDTLADELSGANVALAGLVHNASVLGERRVGTDLTGELGRGATGQHDCSLSIDPRIDANTRSGPGRLGRAHKLWRGAERQSLLGRVRRVEICHRGVYASTRR